MPTVRSPGKVVSERIRWPTLMEPCPVGVVSLQYEVSDQAVRGGLSNSRAGSHTSKTMMLRELRALLAAAPGPASPQEYASAVIEGNVLDKATSATRAKTLLHLRHLYTLD